MQSVQDYIQKSLQDYTLVINVVGYALIFILKDRIGVTMKECTRWPGMF